MNISPRRPSFTKSQKKILVPRPKLDDFVAPQKTTHFPARWNSPTSGGGGGSSNGNSKLTCRDIAWGDTVFAYNSIRPQLFPFEEDGKSLFESKSVATEKFAENLFCLIKLKPYSEEMPPGVFGKVRSVFPEKTTIAELDKVELWTSFRSKILQILTVGSGDVDHNFAAKHWYFSLPVWGTSDDFQLIEGFVDAFHQAGFEITQKQDHEPIEKYFSMGRQEKDKQPWVYVVSSSWLARLPPLVFNTVIANLRLLLESKKRIVVNYLETHPPISLNRSCNLVPGRDELFFYEAWNLTDLNDIVSVAFAKLLNQPLENVV